MTVSISVLKLIHGVRFDQFIVSCVLVLHRKPCICDNGLSWCHQFLPMQGTILHLSVRQMHALSKEIEHMYK